MKKLINSVGTLLAESLDGFATAHSDIVTLGAERKFIRRRLVSHGKVALISGGGSGHEPMQGGFVGLGMLDASCPGEVFTSPPPDQMVLAAEAVDGGDGTLFIVTNYDGDVMNFDMAMELLAAGGRKVASVLTNDDVAVETSLHSTGRRGVAGTMVVEKIVGAAAERGAPLALLKMLGDETMRRTRSMGVALSSCTVPAKGKPTFEIAGDEMEMGVGIHGEPGRRRLKLAAADAIVDEMIGAIAADFDPIANGRPALLFVNGFGATPLMELYLVHNSARRALANSGITVARSLTGTYVSSLDMAGCSLTVTLLDDEMMRLWDAPVHTAAIRWGR